MRQNTTDASSFLSVHVRIFLPSRPLGASSCTRSRACPVLAITHARPRPLTHPLTPARHLGVLVAVSSYIRAVITLAPKFAATVIRTAWKLWRAPSWDDEGVLSDSLASGWWWERYARYASHHRAVARLLRPLTPASESSTKIPDAPRAHINSTSSVHSGAIGRQRPTRCPPTARRHSPPPVRRAAMSRSPTSTPEVEPI